MSYAELQVTTNFSFLRGASHAEELFAQAAALAQLRRLGRSTGYFCGAAARKRESNQRGLLANRL